MLHRWTSSCRTVLARDLWISRKCQRALQFYEILLLSQTIDNVDISFTCCFSPLISPCLLMYSGWNKKNYRSPALRGDLEMKTLKERNETFIHFRYLMAVLFSLAFLCVRAIAKLVGVFRWKGEGKKRISDMDKHQLQRNFHLKTLDGWAGCGDGMRWCTPRSIKTRIYFSLFTKVLQEFLRFFFSPDLGFRSRTGWPCGCGI